MKNLKPTNREKKRYLLLNGVHANQKDIEETILDFIGILGFSEACAQFMKNNEGKTILAINRKSLDKIRASFLASQKDIHIERVSGSINKLK